MRFHALFQVVLELALCAIVYANEDTVVITGLDKTEVITALWQHGAPAPDLCPAWKIAAELSQDFSERYIDYLCGRAIKTSFATNVLNPLGYDNENGAWAMQRVVDGMREKKKTAMCSNGYEGMVVIAGLDKMEVIAALWQRSAPAPELCSVEKIAAELSRSSFLQYIEILCGRVIKTSFAKEVLYTWGYDRENGAGAMQRVVDSIREKKRNSEKEDETGWNWMELK